MNKLERTACSSDSSLEWFRPAFVYVMVVCAVGAVMGLLALVGSKRESQTTIDTKSGAAIVRVRGCEYVCTGVSGGIVYTHAGDCDNPVHRASDVSH